MKPVVGIVFNEKIGKRRCEELNNGEFVFIDSDKVYSLVYRVATQDYPNFPKFDPNADTEKQFSIRRKVISSCLKQEFSKLNDEVINDEVKEKVLASPMLKKIANEVVSPILQKIDALVYGNIECVSFPRTYLVIRDTCASACIYFEMVRKLKKMFTDIEIDQKKVGIPREEYEWVYNPFLVYIRAKFQEAISEEVERQNFVFGEFDLSMWLMMHLAARSVEQVWEFPNNYKYLIDIWNDKPSMTSADKCLEEDISALIESGKVKPNETFVKAEIRRLGDNLAQKMTISTFVGSKKVVLPSSRMSNPSGTFREMVFDREEIIIGKKLYRNVDGRKALIGREKISGKTVIFKEIPSEISALYSNGFCNLHYANSGEIVAFGAYYEGDDLPFAYSAYGKVRNVSEMEMLLCLGYNPEFIFESSRAWNAVWAPENTMSILFSYCHDMLKERFGNKIDGVLTSINPNLGFTATAFRGIHFIPVGVKPTVFSYLYEDNLPCFMPKSEIRRITSDAPEKVVMENQVSFLPTVVFLYDYDHSNREKLQKNPLFVMGNVPYSENGVVVQKD